MGAGELESVFLGPAVKAGEQMFLGPTWKWLRYREGVEHDQGSSDHEAKGFFVDAARVAWEGRVPARIAEPDGPSGRAGRARKDSHVFFDGDRWAMVFVGVSRNALCDVSFAPGRWDLAQDARLRVGAAERAELAQRSRSAVEHVHDRVGRGEFPDPIRRRIPSLQASGLGRRLPVDVAQSPRGVSRYSVRRGDSAVTPADGPVRHAASGHGTCGEVRGVAAPKVDRARRRAWRLAPTAREHPSCDAEHNPAPNNATHAKDHVKVAQDRTVCHLLGVSRPES